MIPRPPRAPAGMTGGAIQKLMRAHGWTIRSFAKRWGLTQKRVRQVRSRGLSVETVPRSLNPNVAPRETAELYVRDWGLMITGIDPWALA